jgi:hypothetical protein
MESVLPAGASRNHQGACVGWCSQENMNGILLIE